MRESGRIGDNVHGMGMSVCPAAVDSMLLILFEKRHDPEY
jgi:hypothetical protein